MGKIHSMLLLLGAAAFTAERQARPLPAGEAKLLVESLCSTCHGPQYISYFPGYDSAAEWKALMSTMIALPRAPGRHDGRVSRRTLPPRR